MRFHATPIDGVTVVELDLLSDARGSFARVFCKDEFSEQELPKDIAQVNLSTSTKAGTVRGLHYQLPPSAEIKLVRCTRGALYDVVVDLRRGSSTFGHWYGVQLDADNKRALVVPVGCAHGFQTLAPDTDVLYHVSQAYDSSRERGVNYADPEIGIEWPHEVTVVSDRDGQLPQLGAADLP